MRFVKLTVLTCAVMIIIAAIAVLPNKLCFRGGKGYTFYCGTSSADCKVVTVQSGAAAAKLCLKNICGEATTYENFDLESFLEKVGAKVVRCEPYSDSVNYYCTANLPYSVNLYETTINLHICVRGNTAKVASPIIFGGY